MDNFKLVYTSIFLIFIIVFTILFVTGCTYSITMVHTEGSATDIVDETATNTPSTTVSIPVTVPAI